MPIFLLAIQIAVTPALSQNSLLQQLEQELVDLSQQTQASVVTVSATYEYDLIDEEESTIWNRKKESDPVEWINVGSGIVVDPHHIVTRLSVVQGSPSITVTYCDSTVEQAILIGGDPDMGLAILEVERVKGDSARAGEPAKIEPHCLVMIVGNSLGIAPAVSLGIVNCIRNDGVIQISANVSAGIAGGPVFDTRGRFIGLLSSMGNMHADQMLVNPLIGAGETLLAHPADRVLERARAIIEDARHSRGWIGVTGNDWPGKVGGVLVRKIRSGSPAEQGGLLLGDIIISINGREVNHALDLATAISRHRPGDAINLGILRGEREIKGLTVRVGDRHQRRAHQTAKIPPSGTLKFEIGKNSPEAQEKLMMLQWRKLQREYKTFQSMIKKD